MKVKLIANPAAGKGSAARLIKKAISALNQFVIDPDVSITEGPGDASALALEALDSHDIVCGLGGDGTLNEIASALKFSGVPMAAFPAGTGNDFIKALCNTTSYDRIAEAVANANVRTVDMAQVNGRDLINVLGIGFDAVVSAENHKVRWLPGLSSYVYALIKSLIKYRHYPLTLTMDDAQVEANALFLTIGNGPVCGGGFRLTPEALPDDGLLDITLISDLPLASLIPVLPKAFNGRIADTPYTRTFRAKSLSITSPAPLPSHIDGEVFTPYASSYDIKVLPGALKVIAP